MLAILLTAQYVAYQLTHPLHQAGVNGGGDCHAALHQPIQQFSHQAGQSEFTVFGVFLLQVLFLGSAEEQVKPKRDGVGGVGMMACTDEGGDVLADRSSPHLHHQQGPRFLRKDGVGEALVEQGGDVMQLNVVLVRISFKIDRVVHLQTIKHLFLHTAQLFSGAVLQQMPINLEHSRNVPGILLIFNQPDDLPHVLTRKFLFVFTLHQVVEDFQQIVTCRLSVGTDVHFRVQQQGFQGVVDTRILGSGLVDCVEKNDDKGDEIVASDCAEGLLARKCQDLGEVGGSGIEEYGGVFGDDLAEENGHVFVIFLVGEGPGVGGVIINNAGADVEQFLEGARLGGQVHEYGVEEQHFGFAGLVEDEVEAQGLHRLLFGYELYIHIIIILWPAHPQRVRRWVRSTGRYYKQMRWHPQYQYLIMMGMAARLNKVGRLAFSSIANPQLTDWEYTTKIQQSLHQNDINEALKYLINSHLDGQVLDMHIFRNYYLKADKLKAGITYSEIAYQLYRHHFKPHSLVLDWMNSLAKSNNHNIINLLQQDFKSLQIEMPQVKKVEQQDSPKPQQTERAQQSKPSESVLASPPTTSNQTKKDSNVVQVSPLPSISGLEKTTGKEILSREEIERMPAISQIRSGLKSILSSLTGLKPSITFHKIQVFMEDSELYFENEGGFSHETTHEGDQQHSDDEYLEDFSYTRKIKVERIEISFNSLQSNQNFGNQNKQN